MKKSCYYILGIMIFSLLFISSTAGQIIENEETELTLQERIEHLGLNISEETKKRFEKINQLPAPPLILTDDEWDWREMDGVTAVKNQRSCGSCWAHSVIAAFESQLLIYDGVEWDLSEQQVVDCNDFNSSCAGGDPAGACRFIIEYGLVEEECYPYINRDGECYQESCDVMAIADDYRDIPNNINAIKNALLYSPISSCFRVYDDLTYDCYWHDYNDATNHSVEIVGWDDNMCGGTGAWIFKNSWGNWGDSGYGYLPYGSCGIGNYSQQPIHYAQSAELSVNPDTLIFYVPSGGEDSRVLQIGNTGYRDLFYRFQLLKSSFQDSYGYYWFDSDDIYGPEYDWIDITQIGDIIEFPGPDPNMSNTGHIDFGFDFDYYGEIYNSICICSNGWASFTDSTTVTAISKHFPLPGPPNAMMTPYWTNLYPGMGGNVYFYTNNSDSVVISWEDVPDAGQIGYFTFQIVLIAPDTVLFQYESMENHNPLARTSIGMEDAEGLVGLEISYCEDYTDGETSVRFNLAQPPGEFDWLSVDVDNGTIIPTEFSDVTITCSAGDHPDGIYFAYMDLHSSDPYNFNIEIPVIMNIGMTSVDENSSLPNHHELTYNYPNPFNSTTTIKYTVSKQSDVSLDIYNLMGQKIERLVDSSHKPGEYSVNWNAYMYSSGVYFYRFIAGSESITKQMTYLK